MESSLDNKSGTGFDFQQAILGAYKRYPEINGQVFFFNGSNREIWHPDEEIGQIAVDFCNKDAGFASLLNKAFQEARHTRLRMPGGMISFIVFYPQEDGSEFGAKDIRDDFLNFVFNHELGHALFDSSRENIADGYALLRHIQNKSDDIRLVHRVAFSRAASAVNHGYLKHYTLPLITRLLELRKTVALEKLSRDQTKSLVKELDKSFPFRHSADIAKDFKKAFASYHACETPEEKCRALQKIIARTHDRDIFEAGSTILKAISDPHIELGAHGAPKISLSQDERDNISKNIDKKARSLRISEYYPQFMPMAGAQ